MEVDDTSRRITTPELASAAVVDALRHLLSALGAVLASPAGVVAVQDAAELRSLPGLAKSLKRLWFDTGTSSAWDSKEQAIWLCRVLAVTEGSRAGLLSFYGAGLLLCDSLGTFAEVSLAELGIPLDEAWVAEALAVQEVLRGRHWEQLQQWPADRRCGGGSDPLLSADRLPKVLKNALDLEGVRLTKVQAAGLGVALLMPGSMTLAMGGLGCAFLVKTARALSHPGQAAEGASQWQALQARCLKHAHELLRRKSCPIEIRYVANNSGPRLIKVSLYSKQDFICALPVGSLGKLGGNSTGGQSSARLESGASCALRPPGNGNSFRLRVYQPSALFDVNLHDGVEVKRGDRVAIVPTDDGKVQCYAERRLVEPASEGNFATEMTSEFGGPRTSP